MSDHTVTIEELVEWVASAYPNITTGAPPHHEKVGLWIKRHTKGDVKKRNIQHALDVYYENQKTKASNHAG